MRYYSNRFGYWKWGKVYYSNSKKINLIKNSTCRIELNGKMMMIDKITDLRCWDWDGIEMAGILEGWLVGSA